MFSIGDRVKRSKAFLAFIEEIAPKEIASLKDNTGTVVEYTDDDYAIVSWDNGFLYPTATYNLELLDESNE